MYLCQDDLFCLRGISWTGQNISKILFGSNIWITGAGVLGDVGHGRFDAGVGVIRMGKHEG